MKAELTKDFADDCFDIPMGSHHGDELLGILNELDMKIGLKTETWGY